MIDLQREGVALRPVSGLGVASSYLGTSTNHALTMLTRDAWVIPELTQGASDLLSQFSQIPAHYSERLQELVIHLNQVSREWDRQQYFPMMSGEPEG